MRRSNLDLWKSIGSKHSKKAFLASGVYRGTSLIRNSQPPRIAIGPYADAYCRFLGRVGFL